MPPQDIRAQARYEVYFSLLFIEASSSFELVQCCALWSRLAPRDISAQAEAGTLGALGPVVLQAVQLWGRLRGSCLRRLSI